MLFMPIFNNDVKLFAGYIFNTLFNDDSYDICLQFYLIDWCNCSCPGCYRRSGPHGSKNSPPEKDIEHIVKMFGRLPNFGNSIGFSGGEPFGLAADKLGRILQIGLDSGSHVELVTNASWARDPEKFKMLSDLNVPKGYSIDPAKLEEIAKSTKGWKKLSLEERRKKIYEKLSLISMLGVTVSVDNLIHSARSADDFVTLAKTITTDPALSDKVNLGVATFIDCKDWFSDQVLYNPELNCSDIVENKEHFEFNINGCPAVGLYQEFGDPDGPETPDMQGQIVYSDPDKENSRKMIFYCWPDRTIGFQNELGNPIGRVSYINKRGGYKRRKTLLQDILLKLVTDYSEKIRI
jgi:pyruvate-formate lyase-activating enzyme